MKRILTFNESLNVSDSVVSVLKFLVDEYNDKVAVLLSRLMDNEYYSDNEDINFIELSREITMLNFRPINRRTGGWDDNFDAEKSQPMKIGRMVKSITNSVKPYLSVKYEADGVIYEADYDKKRKQYILFSGNLDLIYKSSINDPLTAKITVNGKEHTAEFFSIQHSKNRAPKIFPGDSSEISLLYKIQATPDFVVKSDTSGWVKEELLKDIDVPTKKMTIEIESSLIPTDADIEKFTTRVSAYLRSLGSMDAKLQLVNGEKLRYWYNEKNYQEVAGELGYSCMREEESQELLDMYCFNKEVVSLLVLLNNNRKLIGRALVWKLSDGKYFMDRVYTIIPSDKYVFYDWARKNNSIFRCHERNEVYLQVGKEKKDLDDYHLEVNLKVCDFELYPFVDTIHYLDKSKCKLTNKKPSNMKSVVILHSQEGNFGIE